jgi:endoribonuclease Dicer
MAQPYPTPQRRESDEALVSFNFLVIVCRAHLTEEQDDEEAMWSSSDEEEPQQDEYDTDSDIDCDVEHSHGPGTSTEKRRRQNEIFRAYAALKTEEITEKEVKEAIKGAKDDVLSIKDILAKQENSARISNPRDYQTELFQKAKEENIIAVLDTGSGKTHIATLLLRYILDKELDDRAKGGPHKIAFFLVSGISIHYKQLLTHM